MANDIKTFNGYLGTYHMVGKNEYEPQRTNNYEVYVDLGGSNNTPLQTAWNGTTLDASASSGYITLAASSFTPPSVSISNIQIRRGNNAVKYAGVPEFSDCSITLNDYIGIDTEKILMAWQKQSYDIRTQAVGLASRYKKNAWVNQYSPDGTVVRQWVIKGAWLSSLSMGDYSSDDNSVRRITGTIIYDYCYPADGEELPFSSL